MSANSTSRAALVAAYRSARYRIYRRPHDIAIYVGRRNGRLDRLLRLHGACTWCFITAHNPRSRKQSRWRNAAAQARLEAMLKDSGRSTIRGDGSGVQWPVEPSIFVMNIAPPAARRLGKTFRQYAVLVGRIGGITRVLWC